MDFTYKDISAKCMKLLDISRQCDLGEDGYYAVNILKESLDRLNQVYNVEVLDIEALRVAKERVEVDAIALEKLLATYNEEVRKSNDLRNRILCAHEEIIKRMAGTPAEVTSEYHAKLLAYFTIQKFLKRALHIILELSSKELDELKCAEEVFGL